MWTYFLCYSQMPCTSYAVSKENELLILLFIWVLSVAVIVLNKDTSIIRGCFDYHVKHLSAGSFNKHQSTRKK